LNHLYIEKAIDDLYSSLVNFRHVQSKIALYRKDYETLRLYLFKLMQDTRDNTRQCFPFTVASQMIALIEELSPEDDKVNWDLYER